MSATMGIYQSESDWALANPAEPLAKELIGLWRMYLAHADIPTLGMVQGCVDAIRLKLGRPPLDHCRLLAELLDRRSNG